jgi:hypothetical protein
MISALNYICRQCGARFDREVVPDGPAALALLIRTPAGRPGPTAPALHKCSPKMHGIADPVGCTLAEFPGPEADE